MTVALDTNREAARPFVGAAAPTHPSLVDEALSMVDQFGITNVPFALWIDESGVIVRPAEVAFAQHPLRDASDGVDDQTAAAIAQMPEKQRAIVAGMTAQVDRTGRYTDALRDWVANGADSRFVLSPEEVVARSRPRPLEFGMAAAHFELGQHLHRRGVPARRGSALSGGAPTRSDELELSPRRDEPRRTVVGEGVRPRPVERSRRGRAGDLLSRSRHVERTAASRASRLAGR